MNIPTKTLNNGVKIPVLGLGTWKLRGEDCVRTVNDALKCGYNHIDTAEIYGNENEVAKGIGDFERKKLFITSKLFTIEMETPVNYNDALKACEDSLKRLKTDYLDLYLVHWPNKKMDYKEIFRALKKLLDDKKVRAVGVSNFTIHHLQDSLKICNELGLKISMNQVEFHPFLYQKELLEFCTKNGIVVTAYSPLARGKVFKDEKLIEIGKKYEKNAGQVSLRWLLQHGMVVVPKSSSEPHCKSNFNVFDFELSDEDMKEIDGLNRDERQVEFEASEFGY